MLLFIQCDHCPTHRIARFQNILCYCLSIQGITLAGMFFEFQNILCYCLSRLRGRIFSGKLDFKTSYVIVYRIINNDFHFIIVISKHLMLLFIFKIQNLDVSIIWFQNILCYCLSGTGRKIPFPTFNFKTSYVIVYPEWTRMIL